MDEVLNDWKQLPVNESTGELLCFHKRFQDDPDVLISVVKTQEGFEVRSSAESRTSGPNDSIVGTFSTYEEAKMSAETERKDWDAYMRKFAPK